MENEMLWIAVRVVVCCIAFCCFVFLPLKSRFRYSYGMTAALAAILTGITTVITVLFLTHGGYLAEYSTVGILLWIACAVLCFYLAIRGSFFEILFSVLMILNLYVNIMAIARVVMGTVTTRLPFAVAQSITDIGILLAYCPFLWFLMGKLYKEVIEFPIRFPFWKYIWIIPALTYMIFYVKIINDYWLDPARINMVDVIFMILWSFTTYTFFCVTLLMLIQTYKGIMASQQTELMDSQLQMQAGQYERLLMNMEQTSRLRHDLRHHLLTIQGFVKKQDQKGLEQYLAELTPSYLVEETVSLCENHVADVILRHYAALGKTAGVRVEIETHIPKSQTVKDTDLCIILGNLLENAMDACMDQKKEPGSVEIKAGIQGNQMVLMVKNTHENKIEKKGETFLSTKHAGEGIGISSVKNVLDKNHGIMKVEYDERYFSVYVLMQVTGA